MKTKEQIKQHLENGGQVTVGVLSFYGRIMSCCDEGCCSDYYESLDEAADAVVSYSSYTDLSDVNLD